MNTEPDDCTFDADEIIPLTELQKAELDRRQAAMEKDPTAGSTWEQVVARIRAKYRDGDLRRAEPPGG